jgi:hypothetical protein
VTGKPKVQSDTGKDELWVVLWDWILPDGELIQREHKREAKKIDLGLLAGVDETPHRTR